MSSGSKIILRNGIHSVKVCTIYGCLLPPKKYKSLDGGATLEAVPAFIGKHLLFATESALDNISQLFVHTSYLSFLFGSKNKDLLTT